MILLSYKPVLTVSSLIVLLVAFGSSNAQASFEGFTHDSFKGLKLNSATISETTDLLGRPNADRSNVTMSSLSGSRWFRNWFGNNLDNRSYRRLSYKDVGEFNNVDLYFLEDKLIAVAAQLRSPFVKDNPFLSPNDLDSMFDVELKTFIWAFGRKLPPLSEFGPKPNHEIDSKGPFYYLRIGLSESSVVSNFVDNNNENLTKGFIYRRFSPTKKRWDEINSSGPFPGYVTSIQIISRSLIVE